MPATWSKTLGALRIRYQRSGVTWWWMSSAELRCSISSTKCQSNIVPTRSSLPSNSVMPVVEDHLEQRRERRFEVGDVGQMELDVFAFEQLVVGGVRRGVGSLEAWILGDHRLGVGTVGPGVLGLLADERVRLLGDRGVW